jgi:hypothetical protein
MNNLEKGLTIGVAVLVVFALFNAFTVLSMGSKLDSKIAQIKEASKAPIISLTTITASCDECPDITPMIDTIKSAHVNVSKETQVDVKDAKDLVGQYGIEKLPAIIIEGQIDKVSIQNFEGVDGNLVYQTTAAPYYNVRSGKVEGLVEAWLLEANCEECMDMQEIIDAFTLQGVVFSKVNKIGQSSAAAATLIADNKIERLPALLYSDGISAYPEVLVAMEQGGFVKTGDLHLYESRVPFYDVAQGKVKGFVGATYLNDAACTECYDVTIHKQILERFGMVIGSEKTVDISSSEGKGLVAKYSLTSIPAVIVNGDVSLYEGFDQVWSSVGTIENGNYVFRNNAVFLPQFAYKNLTTGEIVKGEVAAQGAQATA